MSEELRQRLSKYVSSFWGYGSPTAKLWFVGPEQAGDVDELEARVRAWADGDEEPFQHLHDFSRRFGEAGWFDATRPPLQSTWKQLIRIHFASRGLSTDNESIRAYQASGFCGDGEEVACIELSPLAVKNIATWPYAEYADAIESLRSRFDYQCATFPRRIQRLREMITEEDGPQAVVCYGTSEPYAEMWRRLCDEGPSPRSLPPDLGTVRTGRLGETVIALISHPVAYGVTNAYFEHVGELIGKDVGWLSATD